MKKHTSHPTDNGQFIFFKDKLLKNIRSFASVDSEEKRRSAEASMINTLNEVTSQEMLAPLINGILVPDHHIPFSFCLTVSRSFRLGDKGISGMFRIIGTRFGEREVGLFLDEHKSKTIRHKISSLRRLIQLAPTSAEHYLSYLLTREDLLENLLIDCLKKNQLVQTRTGRQSSGFLLIESLSTAKTLTGDFYEEVPRSIWSDVGRKISEDVTFSRRFEKWNPSTIKSILGRSMLENSLPEQPVLPSLEKKPRVL